MIYRITHIEQPYSGEYEEKIYDIESSWNSKDWSWIKFEEELSIWCGEFRGKYRGAALSEKRGIVVVLTSDYMYILDIETKDMIDYEEQPSYTEITCTPMGDIFLSDGYGLYIFTGKKIESLNSIFLPVQVDFLKFVAYDGKMLKMSCEEFRNCSNQITLLLDCESLEVMEG